MKTALAFAGAIVLLLWAMLPQIATALIGRDSSFALWSFWFPGHALWLNQDIMITDYLVPPLRQNLLLMLSPINSALTVLFMGFHLNSPLAFNLLYIVSLVFAAWAMAAYLDYLCVPKSLAVLCALLFAFSPVMHYRLLQGRPDLMLLGWIPLGCLVWDQLRVNRQRSFWLAAIVLGAFLSNLHIALWAFVVWFPYIPFTLLQTKQEGKRFLVSWLLLQLLIVLTAIMVYPLPGVLKTLAGLAPNFKPTALLLDEWQFTLGFGLMAALWLGFIGLSCASYNSRAENKRIIWAAIGAVCVALSAAMKLGALSSLDPLITWVDWFAPASMAICVFIALSLSTRWERWQQRVITSRISVLPVILLLGAIALQQAPTRIPWNSSPIYSSIGKEPGNYAVLSVPFGIRVLANGEAFGNGASAEQYAVLHHKRSLNGSLTAPTAALATYTQSSLLQFLAGQRDLSDLRMVQELQEIINRLQIGYVVVDLDRTDLEQQKKVLGFFDGAANLCKVYADLSAIAYRTSWHPYSCSRKFE